MTKIKILPNNLINQIAAGEVIERPASVLKELMENSIDAEATRIEIAIHDGGLTEIEVIDNGLGIAYEDMKTAFIRHATSKIKQEEDLYNLTSLGFRGEALPSIASVSKVTIKSRTKDSAEGHLMVFEGGEFLKHQVVACKIGTTIKVEKLFYNTPARLKFMSSARAEAQRISALFKQVALSHPNVAFKYFRNGKEIVYTNGNGDLRNSITALFDVKLVNNLLELSFTRNGYYVQGYISEPKYSQHNRRNQYFFINKRIIGDNNIRHALEAAYGNMLPPRTYPSAFLDITIPTTDVDVNVHPTKSEVRFANKGDVHALITAAVREALAKSIKLTNSEVAAVNDEPTTSVLEQTVTPQQQFTQMNMINESNIFESYVSDKKNEFEIAESSANKQFASARPNLVTSGLANTNYNEYQAVTHLKTVNIPEELSQFMLLGQVHNSFIVIQNKEGMAVIDQHAAHERIIVERLRQKNNQHHIQYFAVPLTISFSKLTFNLIKDYIDDIKKIGIIIEPFGTNSFLIRGIPDFLAGRLSIEELKEVISEVFSNELNINKWYDNILIRLSCKSAIKIHQALTRAEMLSLIKDLANTPNWRFCPHGRPIIWKISFNDLERKFNRV
ncbi:DNA mismatch repair endonuclease MutL [Clostridium sp. 'deep sea']|uniref:DNA mismatch repair endonuclease MutL n=1 Tax=Clostridium sp. 'deep sea' TaxID=2779445 RepID=UPI00189667E6|nr:DNA mismatch repair endonuclease MutL [Clostridium sp. 'deep sea']QOR35774.1 DNA mismatch repair endonuclease MutL [Clostridium sp. 'deep sea']